MRQSLPETAAETPRQPLVIPVSLGLVGADGSDVPIRIRAATSLLKMHP